MKEVTITIDGGEIASRIFSESGYAALARAKSGIPEQFTDIMQATDDDRKAVGRFIADSINEVAGIISRYMSPCTVKQCGTDGDAHSIMCLRFTIPHNCPEDIIGLLREKVASFAAASSQQRWMLMVKPDEASIHLQKAQSDIMQIRELLSTRTRPVKGSTMNDNIIEM